MACTAPFLRPALYLVSPMPHLLLLTDCERLANLNQFKFHLLRELLCGRALNFGLCVNIWYIFHFCRKFKKKRPCSTSPFSLFFFSSDKTKCNVIFISFHMKTYINVLNIYIDKDIGILKHKSLIIICSELKQKCAELANKNERPVLLKHQQQYYFRS